MALADFSDLKTSITTWLARSDMGGMAEDFITLGEARLNRELNPVETTATLIGVVDSREIDISALAVEEPLALFMVDPETGDEREPVQKTAGTFPYRADSDEPLIWCIEDDKIKFDCPLDQAYSFRFRFTQRFKLSDAAPTNWLLTHHPDVYLAAVIVWGGVLKRDSEHIALFLPTLRDGIPAIRRQLAKSKQAIATVDPALVAINRRNVGYWS